MRPTIVIAAALAAALAQLPAQAAPAARAASAEQQAAPAWVQPSQVIETAAQQLLNALKGHREEYRKDPEKVTPLVDKYLLPHVDTQLAAQLVLGRYWRTATPQQRQRFIDAFYHSMMVNFGGALADFRSNMLKVFPTHLRPGTNFATVRTEMTRSNGSRVSVVYLMQLTPRGWQAFDVHIDGVSYVKSYREDFATQIRQQGLDAVIKRLQEGAKPSAIAHAARGS
jgi:phospholipid transport system substrate-binding protein